MRTETENMMTEPEVELNSARAKGAVTRKMKRRAIRSLDKRREKFRKEAALKKAEIE